MSSSLGNTIPNNGTTPGSSGTQATLSTQGTTSQSNTLMSWLNPGTSRARGSNTQNGSQGVASGTSSGVGGQVRGSGSGGGGGVVGGGLGSGTGGVGGVVGGGVGGGSGTTAATATIPADALLAQYQNMDPATKAVVAQVANHLAVGIASASGAGAGNLAASTVATPPAPSFIFSKAKETTSDTLSREVVIHPCIAALSSVHALRIPLHLFTNKNLSLIARSSSKYLKKQTDGLGKSGTFLHAEHEDFGSEAGLSSALWKEAWSNYEGYLDSACEPGSGIAERWKGHYQDLSRRPTFEQDFAAILEFDIDQRILYFNNPFTYDTIVWHAKLGEAISKHHNQQSSKRIETLERRISQTNTAGRPSFPGSSSRFQPYQRPVRSSSFPAGSSGAPAAGICVICGAGSHSGRDCVARTTVKGRPVVARWDKGALRSVKDEKSYFCFWHNISTCAKSRDVCSGKHICSICGGNHGANSRTCLSA